jgi:Rne/Rng family ribonuclease
VVDAADSNLFVATRAGARAAAWIREHRLVEFHVEEVGRESLIGNIYLGRVMRVEQGLGAAFIEFGAQQPGFLPLPEVDGRLVEGNAAIVQVTRDAMDDKGARLTGRPTIRGVLLILTPGRRGIALSARIRDKVERQRLLGEVKALAAAEEGFVVRSAAQGATTAALGDDINRLRALWRDAEAEPSVAGSQRCLYREPTVDLRLLRDHGASFREIVYDGRRSAETAQRWANASSLALTDRIVYRRLDQWIPSFAEIEEEVDAALAPEVEFASGMRLSFEPGKTLTAIDIDTGSKVGGPGGDAEHTLLRADLEAADEIARQIRLRNLGGIIVVDFIDLKQAEHRRRVADRLREAVSSDSQPCWVGTMSRLGLVEMTRQRRGPSLADRLTTVCSHCEGTGRLPISLASVFGSGVRP